PSSVKQIFHIKAKFETTNTVTKTSADYCESFSQNTLVFNRCARPNVTDSHRTKGAERRTCRDPTAQGTCRSESHGPAVSFIRTVFGSVQGQRRVGAHVSPPVPNTCRFNAVTSAGIRWFSRSRITHVNLFAVEIEAKSSKRELK